MLYVSRPTVSCTLAITIVIMSFLRCDYVTLQTFQRLLAHFCVGYKFASTFDAKNRIQFFYFSYFLLTIFIYFYT